MRWDTIQLELVYLHKAVTIILSLEILSACLLVFFLRMHSRCFFLFTVAAFIWVLSCTGTHVMVYHACEFPASCTRTHTTQTSECVMLWLLWSIEFRVRMALQCATGMQLHIAAGANPNCHKQSRRAADTHLDKPAQYTHNTHTIHAHTADLFLPANKKLILNKTCYQYKKLNTTNQWCWLKWVLINPCKYTLTAVVFSPQNKTCYQYKSSTQQSVWWGHTDAKATINTGRDYLAVYILAQINEMEGLR